MRLYLNIKCIYILQILKKKLCSRKSKQQYKKLSIRFFFSHSSSSSKTDASREKSKNSATHMHFSHQWLFFFIITIIIIFIPLSLCDPRISESGLFCGAYKAKTSNFVPTFVKEMESLSQLITTNHFVTYKTPDIPIYALAECHHDLSQTECLLCFAASRTKIPRCLPSLSARIFLDGCFLRYDNYIFYKESISPSEDTVKCSSENAIVSDYDVFVKGVEYAVGNVSAIAVEKGGGFGAVKVMGVYALAQCWQSVGRDACGECLVKAGKGLRDCRIKKEGRGLNAGCYLRYSTVNFFNDAADHHHGN